MADRVRQDPDGIAEPLGGLSSGIAKAELREDERVLERRVGDVETAKQLRDASDVAKTAGYRRDERDLHERERSVCRATISTHWCGAKVVACRHARPGSSAVASEQAMARSRR